ncbi:LuxR C-terminal-related transcriptional regulator (plasmid) [Arthrobacter sp. D3-18]
MVTLVGPGGVGKTRLALQVGATVRPSYDDGVWFLDFSSVDDPALVPDALLSGLGLRAISTQRAAAQLMSYLAERHLLLLLDNCEHILSGCRQLVESLLENSPRLNVLGTSREPFGIRGERVIPVLPFELPQQGEALDETAVRRFDSLAFLCDRAMANSPDFRINNENVAAAAELCARLDGIPLALELAATRLRSLSIGQLLERTKSRFAILTSGSPTAPARQQTLRALIDWSHDRCSAEEQVLWRRMSVFAGSADLEAVEQVCSDTVLPRGQILPLIDSLVSKSVLIAIVTPSSVRYRVLETIRQYALERAQSLGEDDELKQRHALYYMRLAQTSTREFWSTEQDALIGHLRLEHENLRSALAYLLSLPEAKGGSVLLLAAELRFHWMVGGYVSEGRHWLHLALATPGHEEVDRARALCIAAWAAAVQGDLAEGRELLDSCTRLIENLKCRNQIALLEAEELQSQVQTWSGTILLFGGDPEGAATLFEGALAHSRQKNHIEGIMLVLLQLSVAYAVMSDYEKADAVSTEAIELSESLGETYVKSVNLWSQSYCSWAQGDPEKALQYAHESLNRSLIFDDKVVTALNLEVVFGALAQLAKYEDAAMVSGMATRSWESVESSIAAFGPELARAHDRAAERTARALGPRLHREAVARGYKMGADEVIAHLLGLARPTHKSAAQGVVETLTKRQLQVSQLIAAGQSNREIADNLVLSTRTVEGHVESILAKLGLKSRTQIASWVNQRSVLEN